MRCGQEGSESNLVDLNRTIHSGIKIIIWDSVLIWLNGGVSSNASCVLRCWAQIWYISSMVINKYFAIPYTSHFQITPEIMVFKIFQTFCGTFITKTNHIFLQCMWPILIPRPYFPVRYPSFFFCFIFYRQWTITKLATIPMISHE